MADDFLDSLTEAADKATEGLKDITTTYIGLNKIIPTISDMFGDQASQLRMLNKELGTGTKTSAMLRKEMAKISMQTGISTQAQLKLLSATKEYHKQLSDGATKASLRFQKASGANIDIIGKFAAHMKIMGQESESVYNSMYTSLMAVREQYGLTSNQVEDLTESLTKYSVIVGLSSKNIEEASTNLGVFMSKLTSVGIEADTVSNIIDSMIDPDKMLDNIMLLTKLGLSMNDVIAGDPASMLEDSAVQMQALGQQIADMAENNRFAANEMAKMYGLSLEDAIKMSKIDTSEQALNREKDIDTYANEVKTLQDSVANLGNILGGAFMTPISMLGDITEKFTNTLGTLPRSILSTLLVAVGVKVLGKLKDGFASLAERAGGAAGKKFLDTVSPAMQGYLGAVQQKQNEKDKDVSKIKESTNTVQPAINKLNAAKNSATPWADYVYQNTMDRAESIRIDKMGGKSTDYTSAYLKIGTALEEAINKKFPGELRLNELLNKKDLNDKEIKELESLKTNFTTWSQEQKEVVKALTNVKYNQSTEKIDNWQIYKTNLENGSTETKKQYLSNNKENIMKTVQSVVGNNVSKYFTTDIFGKNIGDVSKLMDAKDSSELLKAASNRYESLKEQAKKERDSLKAKQNLTKDEQAYLEELRKRIKEYDYAILNLNKEREKIVDSDIDPDTLIKQSKARMTKADNVANGVIQEGKKVGFGDWGKNILGSLVASVKQTKVIRAGAGLVNFFRPSEDEEGNRITVGQKAKNLASKGWQGVKKGVGTAAVGVTEFTKKAFSGLLKGAKIGLVVGIVSKIADKLKNTEKFQDIVKNVTERLSNIVESVSSSIMPAVEGLFDKVSPAIDKIANKLAPTITSFVENLVPLIGNLASNIVPLVADITSNLMPILIPAIRLISGALNFIMKGVTFILKGINGILKWFGKSVDYESEISTNTNPLKDNYDKEDLKTMTLAYTNATAMREERLFGTLESLEAYMAATAKNTKETVTKTEELGSVVSLTS